MAAARLLDLTRLVSRLGRGPLTGIDRVELAYLRHFLSEAAPLFALIRTAAGWLLLDRSGCARLLHLLQAEAPLPPADLLSRLLHRKDKTRARAETAARKTALTRAARSGLSRLLRRLPPATTYFNVGHANLTDPGLAALKAAGLSVTVMVHDTIPLDHPEFTRPDTVQVFRRKLAAVAHHADRVIHLTNTTRQGTEAQLSRLGRIPPALVAPLGVDLAQPDPAALPEGLAPTSPFYLCLGTIEPRKNHPLLLDVWERLPQPAPTLFIIGNRGWADKDLLARLDALPRGGPVQEINGLSDGAVAALLSRATALLAPSRAEGFGLPPLEAASLGIPVIAADLPVTRETIGNKAVYLPSDDIYSWVETIVRQSAFPQDGRPGTEPPIRLLWADHFNAVLSLGG